MDSTEARVLTAEVVEELELELEIEELPASPVALMQQCSDPI